MRPNDIKSIVATTCTSDSGVNGMPIAAPIASSIAACISEVVMPPRVLPTKTLPLLTGATITLFKKSNFLSHIMYDPKNTELNIIDMATMPGNMKSW